MRSNGTVTYVGKDIAYQFWKFGLLGLDFSYRPFTTRRDGSTLWATTSDPAQAAAHGDGARVRPRGDDLQRDRRPPVVPAEAAEAGARHDGAHRPGGAIDSLLVRDGGALARDRPRAGIRAVAEDQKKPFVEVSGRKGLGVKADDLLDLLEKKATQEVQRRNPGADGR